MNDHGSNDHLDPDLGDRMDRAVGGLRAPDVVAGAIARGQRQRTRRRLAYGAGGLAAATALALTVPTFAAGWSGQGSPVGAAADPAPTSLANLAATPDPTLDPTANPCGASEVGWWSKSSDEVRNRLAALLPAGVSIGRTDDDYTGTWGGNLDSDGDEDFAELSLLPPAGTPGGLITLDDAIERDPCAVGNHEPLQEVKPCRYVLAESCEEIRSEDGELIGVATDTFEEQVAGDDLEPTDRGYVVATIKVSGGGHVELYVAEGTRADRPGTIHDPADVPALTPAQARAIVTDPFWTS